MNRSRTPLTNGEKSLRARIIFFSIDRCIVVLIVVVKCCCLVYGSLSDFVFVVVVVVCLLVCLLAYFLTCFLFAYLFTCMLVCMFFRSVDGFSLRVGGAVDRVRCFVLFCFERDRRVGGRGRQWWSFLLTNYCSDLRMWRIV